MDLVIFSGKRTDYVNIDEGVYLIINSNTAISSNIIYLSSVNRFDNLIIGGYNILYLKNIVPNDLRFQPKLLYSDIYNNNLKYLVYIIDYNTCWFVNINVMYAVLTGHRESVLKINACYMVYLEVKDLDLIYNSNIPYNKYLQCLRVYYETGNMFNRKWINAFLNIARTYKIKRIENLTKLKFKNKAMYIKIK
jgi:hypothetical protein